MSRTNEDDSSAAPMSGVVLEVWTERVRQVQVEGYTPDRDDRYDEQDLAIAAHAYILAAINRDTLSGFLHVKGDTEDAWPWDPSTFKPTTPRANLVKACALLIAEIERQDRATAKAAA